MYRYRTRKGLIKINKLKLTTHHQKKPMKYIRVLILNLKKTCRKAKIIIYINNYGKITVFEMEKFNSKTKRKLLNDF